MQNIRKRLPVILLSAALVAALVWGAAERRRQDAYRANLENMYERSFYELVNGVGNMEVQLSKLLISETPEMSLSLLSDIRHKADSVQSSFSVLPMQDENTAKFVNQLGDYCNSLSQRVAQGMPITAEQREQLQSLRDHITTLGNQMRGIQTQAVDGQTALWEASLALSQSASISDPLSSITHTGVDYPSLVYDGPFSDARKTPPKALGGAWVDYDGAERIARSFVGEGRVEWSGVASEVNGDIPSYGVEMMLSRDGVATVQVTKQGGHILWMVPERTPGTAVYDLNQCLDAAFAFMDAQGYPDMTLSYYQAYNNTAVFNLVPVQDGVLLYSDLVKLQISMETCQVIGIEAGNYLRNHEERILPDIQFPLEDALLLATRLIVEKTQMALVPKLDKEVLCHEITGTYLGEQYILYVDATTGAEVDLFKILDVEGGRLAM